MVMTRVELSSGLLPSIDGPQRVIDVELPAGWRRVWSGAVKPGDLWLHRLLAFDGIMEWHPVEEQSTASWAYANASTYTCLIRNDGGDVQEPCERCQHRVKERGKRFCWVCCDDVVRQGRTASKMEGL